MNKFGASFQNGARYATLIMAGLAVLATIGPPTTPASAMQAYKWKYRPLLVFAPAPDNRNLTRQRKVFAGRTADFKARDIVVVSVIGGQLWNWLGPGPGMTIPELRRRFGVDRGKFRAILVGKDGGVKISSAEPITAEQLIGTIDAMPMRRREMREKQ